MAAINIFLSWAQGGQCGGPINQTKPRGLKPFTKMTSHATFSLVPVSDANAIYEGRGDKLCQYARVYIRKCIDGEKFSANV